MSTEKSFFAELGSDNLEFLNTTLASIIPYVHGDPWWSLWPLWFFAIPLFLLTILVVIVCESVLKATRHGAGPLAYIFRDIEVEPCGQIYVRFIRDLASSFMYASMSFSLLIIFRWTENGLAFTIILFLLVSAISLKQLYFYVYLPLCDIRGMLENEGSDVMNALGEAGCKGYCDRFWIADNLGNLPWVRIRVTTMFLDIQLPFFNVLKIFVSQVILTLFFIWYLAGESSKPYPTIHFGFFFVGIFAVQWGPVMGTEKGASQWGNGHSTVMAWLLLGERARPYEDGQVVAWSHEHAERNSGYIGMRLENPEGCAVTELECGQFWGGRMLFDYIINSWVRQLLIITVPVYLMLSSSIINFVTNCVAIIFIADLDDRESKLAVQIMPRVKPVVAIPHLGHQGAVPVSGPHWPDRAPPSSFLFSSGGPKSFA